MTNIDDDRTDDPDSALDTAGAPYADGLDSEIVEAESTQTVTNDAVAGETVLGDDGAAPEIEPVEGTAAPANDGYLAPRAITTDDVDLDDGTGADGESA